MSSLVMDLSVKAERVNIEPQNYQTVLVESFRVEKRDVLDHFDLNEIFEHFEENKIMDFIGKERVMEYFDLVEVSD